jgi:PhnB protein
MECMPYLFFSGNCEEALNYYKKLFNGEIESMTRVKDTPSDDQRDASRGEKVMHSTFNSKAVNFMASDARPETKYGESRISLSLGTTDEKEAERVFNGLAAGGNVEMPLENTFWGAKFGMLTDKFGIDWMVNCQLEKPS